MASSDLKESYQEMASNAGRFSDIIVTEINQLLASHKLRVACPVECRIKSWKSCEDKIRRSPNKISCVSDLHDLVGVRLVLLFRRDVELALNIIRRSFVVLEQENTAERLTSDQFGYASHHFVIKLPQDWLSVPTYKEFENFKAELQIRTLAQHMWAASSHVLQYKQESSIPPPMRRTIHRVSALLETIDLEFERLLHEKSEYLGSLDDEAVDHVLNVDVLERDLDLAWPARNKDVEDTEEYAELLEELLYFEENTSKKLHQLIDDQYVSVMHEEQSRLQSAAEDFALDEMGDSFVSRLKNGIFFTHVGLTRIALAHKYGDSFYDRLKAVNRKKTENE